MDCGDHVIIVNADKVVLTGGKEMKKVAYRHSGYPGGITGTRYDALMAERPVFAVEKAIKGMLPKNRLGRSMVRKLHVVAGAEHPHAPQKPEPYTLGRPPKSGGPPAEDPPRRPGEARLQAEGSDGTGEGAVCQEDGGEEVLREEAHHRQEDDRQEDGGEEVLRQEAHRQEEHGEEAGGRVRREGVVTQWPRPQRS